MFGESGVPSPAAGQVDLLPGEADGSSQPTPDATDQGAEPEACPIWLPTDHATLTGRRLAGQPKASATSTPSSGTASGEEDV